MNYFIGFFKNDYQYIDTYDCLRIYKYFKFTAPAESDL